MQPSTVAVAENGRSIFEGTVTLQQGRRLKIFKGSEGGAMDGK